MVTCEICGFQADSYESFAAHACWAALKAKLDAANLQVGEYRKALEYCVSQCGCSWSAQGEYDECKTGCVVAPQGCAICQARDLLRGTQKQKCEHNRFSKSECPIGSGIFKYYCSKCGASQGEVVEKRKDDGCARLSPPNIAAGTLTCNGLFGHEGKHYTYWSGQNLEWD